MRVDYTKRSVEHYRDHELVCSVRPQPGGWSFAISIVSHDGDRSTTHSEEAAEALRSEIDALQAGMARARALVDASLKTG